MNIKKQTKEEKAKQILMENNWFRDYYYIKKVIESNKNSDIKLSEELIFNSTLSIINTRKWGFKILDEKIQNLSIKYPKYKEEIFDIFFQYKEDLRNIYENVWSYAVNKNVKKAGDEIFK